MLLAAFSVSFTSCGDDEDDPISEQEFTLTGTRWTYTDSYTDSDGSKLTIEHGFTFSERTANYSITTTLTQGTQNTTSSDYVSYTYVYSEGLVVLTPQTSGKAYLEGVITSKTKMEVTNVSSGKVIGTFYKN